MNETQWKALRSRARMDAWFNRFLLYVAIPTNYGNALVDGLLGNWPVALMWMTFAVISWIAWRWEPAPLVTIDEKEFRG